MNIRVGVFSFVFALICAAPLAHAADVSTVQSTNVVPTEDQIRNMVNQSVMESQAVATGQDSASNPYMLNDDDKEDDNKIYRYKKKGLFDDITPPRTFNNIDYPY